MTLGVTGGPTNAGSKRPLKPRPTDWKCPACDRPVRAHWAQCPACQTRRPT